MLKAERVLMLMAILLCLEVGPHWRLFKDQHPWHNWKVLISYRRVTLLSRRRALWPTSCFKKPEILHRCFVPCTTPDVDGKKPGWNPDNGLSVINVCVFSCNASRLHTIYCSMWQRQHYLELFTFSEVCVATLESISKPSISTRLFRLANWWHFIIFNLKYSEVVNKPWETVKAVTLKRLTPPFSNCTSYFTVVSCFLLVYTFQKRTFRQLIRYVVIILSMFYLNSNNMVIYS